MAKLKSLAMNYQEQAIVPDRQPVYPCMNICSEQLPGMDNYGHGDVVKLVVEARITAVSGPDSRGQNHYTLDLEKAGFNGKEKA